MPVTNLQHCEAIKRVLYNYCRGLDRMDKDLAYSVFTPSANANYYGIYEGSGHGFVDWVWGAHNAMARHSHQLSNILIDIDGNSAVSEAYVTVTLWTAGEQPLELVARGRYLDSWAYNGEAWQITDRIHVVDTQSANGQPVVDGVAAEYARDLSDPSWELFKPLKVTRN